MSKPRAGAFFLVLLSFFLPCSLLSAAPAVKTVEWRDLSDRTVSADGRAALQIDRELWHHAETEHFVYHFRDLKEAETVYVHAEGYYEWVKKMFGVAEDAWPSKCHIYIFNDELMWKEFNKKPGERLPGAEAYTNGTELFIYRKPFYLEPQKALAHEITHIVAHRFIKGQLPLYLNEGIAEYMSYKALAQQADGNEFALRTVALIPEGDFIPLEKLAAARDYPFSDKEKGIFYQESELFVRYLVLNHGADKFHDFLKRSAEGQRFADALKDVYGLDRETAERKFRVYAMVASQK